MFRSENQIEDSLSGYGLIKFLTLTFMITNNTVVYMSEGVYHEIFQFGTLILFGLIGIFSVGIAIWKNRTDGIILGTIMIVEVLIMWGILELEFEFYSTILSLFLLLIFLIAFIHNKISKDDVVKS